MILDECKIGQIIVPTDGTPSYYWTTKKNKCVAEIIDMDEESGGIRIKIRQHTRSSAIGKKLWTEPQYWKLDILCIYYDDVCSDELEDLL